MCTNNVSVCEDCDGMCNTVAVFSVNVVNLSISSNDKKPLSESVNNSPILNLRFGESGCAWYFDMILGSY